jgi:hypothetical protein
MAIDIQGAMHDLIMSILGGRDTAESVAADTSAAVHAAGLAELEPTMTVADFQAQVAAVCEELEGQLSAEVHAALSAYAEGNGGQLSPPSGAVGSSGGGGSTGGGGGVPAPAAPSAPLTQTVLQEQLQYVTYVTYEGDESIVNEIYEDYSTNIDNSVDVDLDVDGDFDGDLDIETTNVNATGDGAIAAGDDIDNAATGGGVVVDGDNYGGIATGDGAVATGEDSDLSGAVNTGEFTGVQAGENAQVENVVVGDGNTAVQADGDVNDVSVVSGDVGGDVVSIGDFDDGSLAFGDGAQASNVSDIDAESGDVNVGQTTGDGITQVDTSDTAAAQGGNAIGDVDDAAVNMGAGDVTNISDLDDGSAASADGDATGSDINDAFNENQAPVNVEQGAGDQEIEQAQEVVDDLDGLDS